VLFIDLVDFTAVAEQLDAEDVRDILGRYFEAARSAIARHGGTLEKFIGDAVMAVWGTPSSHEDDSERAVRAGLDSLSAISELGLGTQRPLRVRAAVASGEAAVTLPATGQGLVAGDLVNTAARLQKLAEPGTLLVDALTRQLASAGIEFEALGDRRLRGKRNPQATWLARAPIGVRPLRGAHVGPFVGRDAELAQLEAAVDGAVAERRMRVVSIVGIAGIGKSRLCWELERRLRGRAPAIRWLNGRASDYRDAGTFAPLADIVRQLLGLRDGAPDRSVRSHIRTNVERLAEDAGERAWLAAALRTLLIPGTPASSDQADLFAAWRRFIELATANTPSVIVFEDAQWAAPELLDFIEQLLRSPFAAPLLVAVLSRPELAEARPAWLAGEQTISVRLGRVSESAIDELLVATYPELTPAARRRVRERADGVPLYAVELVRMLLDRGALSGAELEAVTADLPPTLRALISARVDALPSDPRRTLLAASVLGGSFARNALVAVAADESRVAASLPVLIQRDFLVAERDAVRFVQGLVRDVAYRTLGRRERRADDLSAADYCAASGPAAVEQMAEHLWSAHGASRDEPGSAAVAERARAALVAAAAHASLGRAHLTALGQLERALQLTVDVASRAELHEQAGAAAQPAGRLDAAEGHFRQAIALRSELGEMQATARATAQLAGVLLHSQQNRSALEELESAWRRVDPSAADPPDLAMAELASQLARVHMVQGNGPAALEWADRTIALARRLSAEALALEGQVTRATARVRLADSGGIDELREVSDQAALAGLLGTQLRALNNLSWLLSADDPRASRESARRAVDIAERFGAQDMVMQLTNVLAAAAVDTGDWEPVVGQLDELITSTAPIAYRIDAAITRSILAAIRGEDEPARHLDTVGHPGRSVDAQLRGVVEYARAWIAFADGRHAEAVEHARRAARAGLSIDRFKALALAGRAALWAGDLATADRAVGSLEKMSLAGRSAEAMRWTLSAGLAARRDLAAEANALFDRAEERWRELDVPLQLGLCLLEREKWLPNSKSGEQSAADVLGGVGAAGLVGLLDNRTGVR
jgi:class 3 adenylate cyclase/tetratricopeptide (TPR) repeat protein